MHIPREAFQTTAARLHQYLDPTPVISVEGHPCFLKLENEQPTGSFKVRGALAKVLANPDRGRVVAASTGNHGLAVSYACEIAGVEAEVFVPTNIIDTKRNRLDKSGVRLVSVGEDCVESEHAARRAAEHDGSLYISPYNDIDVVVGQGTIMEEMLEQIPALSRVYVAVGGGGLCSGIALAAEALGSEIELIACSPSNSCVMFDSLQAGRVVEDKGLPTLSDGTAGGIEADSITIDICREHIDRWVLISESEIKLAMEWARKQFALAIEGAAGVAVAAWQKDPDKTATSAVIICGGDPSQGRITDRQRKPK